MYIKLLRLGRVKRRRQTRLAQYNIYDARTYLSRLVDRVIDGEEIVIARANRPVAKLVPYEGFELTQPAVLRAKILLEEVPPLWTRAGGRDGSTNGSTPDPAEHLG